MVLAAGFLNPAGAEKHGVALEIVAAAFALPAVGVFLGEVFEVVGVVVGLVGEAFDGGVVAEEVFAGHEGGEVDSVGEVAFVASAVAEILDMLDAERIATIGQGFEPVVAVEGVAQQFEEPVEAHDAA